MDRRGWTETALTAAVSLVMSVTGLLLPFFMIPLQVVALRRGEKAFLISASGVFFGNLILKMALSPETDIAGSGLMADSVLYLLLLAGLYAVNFRLNPMRKVEKLLVVTAVTGLISIPVIVHIESDQAFYKMMIDTVDSFLVMLKGASAENNIFGALTPEGMYALIRDSFLGSFLFVYFAFLALTIRVGSSFALRTMGRTGRKTRLMEFNVPERLVWFLFIPLTIVLLQLLLSGRGWSWDTGIIGFAVSNCLYIMGVLYGLQGFGLVQYLLEKKNVNPRLRGMAGWMIPLSLIFFPLNLIVILLLPGLGVSELWINYRHNDKELVQ